MPAATGLVELPCQVISNHPSAHGKPIAWKAAAERVGQDILLIHNAIPELDKLPEIARTHEGLFAKTTIVGTDYKDKIDDSYRRCDRLCISATTCPDELLLYSLLLRSVEPQFLTFYFQNVNEHATVKIGSGYDLLRYFPGGFYNEHIDVAHDHPVLGHRRLSVVLFCNDDYEGGALHFPRQELTIQPEKGLMAIFPSGITHPHAALPVTSGMRYSIVSWFF